MQGFGGVCGLEKINSEHPGSLPTGKGCSHELAFIGTAKKQPIYIYGRFSPTLQGNKIIENYILIWLLRSPHVHL